jgi:hypothetical protein
MSLAIVHREFANVTTRLKRQCEEIFWDNAQLWYDELEEDDEVWPKTSEKQLQIYILRFDSILSTLTAHTIWSIENRGFEWCMSLDIQAGLSDEEEYDDF